MLKKHLLVSAVAMGLSSIALANGSIAPVATAACDTEYTPGVYIGIQGGVVDSGLEATEGLGGVYDYDFNLLNTTFLDTSVSRNWGLSGRVFLGYDINKYFAIEAGYLFDFQKVKIKNTYTTETYDSVGQITSTETSVSTNQVRIQAVDLVGKLKAPITDAFGLYAKLGPGYLMLKPDHGDDLNKFDVVYGAGAYYTFATNWNVDLSWTRYNSGHTKLDQDWQPVVDFYALGLSYKFDMPV